MGWGDFSKGLNNIVDGLGSTLGANPKKTQGKATDATNQARAEYEGINVPATRPVTATHANQTEAVATNQGPSAYNGISTDPANVSAQRAQLAALSQLAANGGRNAASDNNLAQIQNQENQNARSQRDAILAGAASRGQLNSGNTLLAQLSDSQNSTNNQSARDSAISAQEAQTALQAGQGAANIGSNLENQDFGEQATKAGANDAISRFNAQNLTGVNVYNAGQANDLSKTNANTDNTASYINNVIEPNQTFGQQVGLAGAKAGADLGVAKQYNSVADGQAAGQSQMLGGLFGAGANYFASKPSTPAAASGGSSLAGADSASSMAAFAARGGQVQGEANVPGDSYSNDSVPVVTSPGEVIVPRSIVNRGNPKEIASFVKNPPPVPQARSLNDKNKAAMLSALKNISSRR